MTQDQGQFLSFTLGESDYAVGILQVKEILQYENITHVPGVPSSVRGVINLRGAVVPVIDLAVKFGFAAMPVTKRTCVLIVESKLDEERVVMGVLADAVKEVLELGKQDVEPPPTFGTNVKVEYITGLAKAGKGFVLLLDLDRLISARETGVTVERGDIAPPPPESVGAATPEPTLLARPEPCGPGP